MELDAFLHRCHEAKIKHVCVDTEMRSYQAEKNQGPFYYTRDVFDGFHYLYNQAKSQGFQVEVSTYAFAAHPFFDEQHCVTLPPKYVDNTDYEAICNGIYVEVFSTFDELWEIIAAQPEKELVIFGYGRNGRMIAQELARQGKAFVVIDNYWQKFSPEEKVQSAKTYFRDKNHKPLIIVTMEYMDLPFTIIGFLGSVSWRKRWIFLHAKSIDMLFCLSWDTENWTTLWDGGDKSIIYEQKLTLGDFEKFF